MRGKDKETLIQDLLVGQYEKYYRMAYSYVHSENDAQDIVQEAAYKAIYHAEKLKEPGFADTWICRIVINEAINFIKKNKKPYVELEEVDVSREEVYEDVDTLRVKAEELAKELAAKAPITMKIDKRLIYDAVGKQPTDIAQRDALALGFVFTTHDAIEGLNAFLEKRPAKYEGR